MIYRRLFTALLLILITTIVWRWMFGTGHRLPGDLARSTATPAGPSVQAEPLPGDRALRMLSDSSYDGLEAWLLQLRQDYKRDAGAEYALHGAYTGFGADDARVREQIDAWVEKKPHAVEARLARAIQRLESARRRGGGAFRSEVSPEALPGFDRLLALAREDAEAALEGDAGHPLAWWALARAAGGQEGADAVAGLHERLMRNAAASYYAHHALLDLLQPRRGGSYEAMDRYAREAQEQVSRNPRLAVLQGAVHAARAGGLATAKDYEAAAAEYDRAVGFGDDPDVLRARAAVRIELLRFRDAMDDYRRQGERFADEESGPALAGAQQRMRDRVDALHRAGEERQALQACKAFLELWPGDAGMLRFRERAGG